MTADKGSTDGESCGSSATTTPRGLEETLTVQGLGLSDVLEAVKGFRRLKGHRDRPTLVATLRARDQRLGLTAAEEKVARGG